MKPGFHVSKFQLDRALPAQSIYQFKSETILQHNPLFNYDSRKPIGYPWIDSLNTCALSNSQCKLDRFWSEYITNKRRELGEGGIHQPIEKDICNWMGGAQGK